MDFANVTSTYKRNGREEVVVLPAGDGKEVHLHPGMNAIPAELWAVARTGERAQRLLKDGLIGEVEPLPRVAVTVNVAPGVTSEQVAETVQKTLKDVLVDASHSEQ